MNKIFLTIALTCTGFLALPYSAQAAEDISGFFIDGQIGRSKVNKEFIDDTDTAFGINGGYRWGWFGVEIGYIDFGKFNSDPSTGSFITAGTANARLHGFNLGVNGHFNLNENWYLSGRVGAFYYHAKEDAYLHYFDLGDTWIHKSESGFKPYAGLGFGYDFANNFSLGLNYDYYWADKHDLDVSGDLISLNLEYRFR